jgi:hypothetical protein
MKRPRIHEDIFYTITHHETLIKKFSVVFDPLGRIEVNFEYASRLKDALAFNSVKKVYLVRDFLENALENDFDVRENKPIK